MTANCFTDASQPLSWDALDSYVLPWTLGAPVELLRAQARLSAIEFCRRSGILHDENYIDLQTNVNEYFLTTVCDYEIVRVYEVTMLNQWTFRPTIQKPMRNAGLLTNSVGYWGASWWAGPYGFYMRANDVIQITPATQKDYPAGLRVEFIVQPKQDGCVLDNYLYEFWAEGIAAGAIARLKMINKTDWYDPAGAKSYQSKFEAELNRARANVDMNFTSGPVRMRAERFV